MEEKKGLEKLGWKVEKHTVYQDKDGEGEFSPNPDWDHEGSWESFICRKKEEEAHLLVNPDSTGIYTNVFGPAAKELMKDLKTVWEEMNEEDEGEDEEDEEEETQDEIELPLQMNIYKIVRPTDRPGMDYDMYDSAVVIAPDGLTAQKMHPYKGNILNDDARPDDWCPWKDVQVVKIGKASAGMEQGVVCASFHAA